MKDSLGFGIKSAIIGWWVKPLCYLLMHLMRQRRFLISLPDPGIFLDPMRISGLLLRNDKGKWIPTIVLELKWDEQTKKYLDDTKKYFQSALEQESVKSKEDIKDNLKKGGYLN